MNLLKKNGGFRKNAVSAMTDLDGATVAMVLTRSHIGVVLSIGHQALAVVSESATGGGDYSQSFRAGDLRELATELNRVADALDKE